MHFIMMDLKGKFKLSPKSNKYTLAVTGMLTNYSLCILLLTNKVGEVVHDYLVNVYYTFGGPHKSLSDNGTELKNNLFAHISFTLGMKQVFRFPYYQQVNQNIKTVHNFLKMCIWKHISSELAWDKVAHIACAA